MGHIAETYRLYPSPINIIGISPLYDTLSGVDDGIIIKRKWHTAKVVVAVIKYVTLWPILSVIIPNIGTRNTPIK